MSDLAKRWAEEMLDCGRSCGVSLDTAEAVSIALARARVVGVLDAWALDNKGFWLMCRIKHSHGWAHGCEINSTLSTAEHTAITYEGPTPDAARAAAAKAIEAGEA